MDPEARLTELERKVTALERNSSNGEQKSSIFSGFPTFGFGTSTPTQNGGSRRKSRQSKKSNKSKKYRHSRR
jgi:hypothetical protein